MKNCDKGWDYWAKKDRRAAKIERWAMIISVSLLAGLAIMETILVIGHL